MTMRLLVDEAKLDEDAGLALYRALVRWAAPRASRFTVHLYPSHYGGEDDLESLRRLAAQETPDAFFVEVMTTRTAPGGAIAGDYAPVEDLALYDGDRRLYSCSDYGRTQLLELTPEELDELRDALAREGLPGDVLVPAPTGDRG